MKKLACLCFFMSCLLLIPTTVFAQTGGGGEQIVIIQKNKFTKAKRIELTLLGGVIPSNPFITYIPFEGRLAFHITEGFGIEAGGGYFPPFENKNDYTGPLKNGVIEDLSKHPHYLGVHIFEQQLFYANLDFLWTPIYGKIQFFGANWITYWEISLQIGGGVTGVYDDERSGRLNDDENNPLRIRPTFNFGASFRLWLNRYMTFKVDVREYLFQKQVGKGGLSQSLAIMLGLSLII